MVPSTPSRNIFLSNDSCQTTSKALHLHRYVDPSQFDYYSTALAASKVTRVRGSRRSFASFCISEWPDNSGKSIPKIVPDKLPCRMNQLAPARSFVYLWNQDYSAQMLYLVSANVADNFYCYGLWKMTGNIFVTNIKSFYFGKIRWVFFTLGTIFLIGESARVATAGRAAEDRDKMSIQASLRFEADKQPQSSHLRKAYEDQIERIKVCRAFILRDFFYSFYSKMWVG